MSLGRIIKFLLCIFGSLLVFNNSVKAETNPYSKMQTINSVTTVSCTWFAWQQAYEKLGVELPRWGNAVNWYERASDKGYKVGSIAKPNSIAVWKNSSNIYGHVAYVVSVNNNSMIINEGGITTTEYDNTTNETKIIPFNGDGIYYNNVVSLSLNRSETSTFLGFIYLANEDILSLNEIEKKDNSKQEIMVSSEEKPISSSKIVKPKKEKEKISKIDDKTTKASNKIEEKIITNEEVNERKTLPTKELINKPIIKKIKIKKKYIIIRNLIITIFFLLIIIIAFFHRFIKNVILKPLYLWYNLN